MRYFVLLTAMLLGSTSAPALAPGYLGYDPDADPANDLEAAIEQARRDNKRIIVVVGGEWCVWCKILQEFLILNRDIKQQWEKSYVTLKVYFGPENQNESFLSQYPEIRGYPHLFVLDTDGSFLHSQPTGQLEGGRSYSKKKVKKLLQEWQPEKRS